MAAEECRERYNNIANILHNWIAYKMRRVEHKTPYYNYHHEHVCETETVVLY